MLKNRLYLNLKRTMMVLLGAICLFSYGEELDPRQTEITSLCLDCTERIDLSANIESLRSTFENIIQSHTEDDPSCSLISHEGTDLDSYLAKQGVSFLKEPLEELEGYEAILSDLSNEDHYLLENHLDHSAFATAHVLVFEKAFGYKLSNEEMLTLLQQTAITSSALLKNHEESDQKNRVNSYKYGWLEKS